MKRFVLILTVVLAALGEDFYWQPNSNWNNPSNWKLGRVPCGSDVASFPENTVVFLDEDVSLQTIMLPENGQIILGANVAVTLSEDSDSCNNDGPGDIDPVPTSTPGAVNEFVGATPRYWECSGNWLTADNFPAQHPPCGADNAIFPDSSYFHYVAANESIYVRSLQVRGQPINSQAELDANEFRLAINIVPDCGTSPDMCPCPSDEGCPIEPGQVTDTVVGSGPGAIAGTIIGVILILLIIAAVIVIVALVMYKRKKSGGYKKDDFLEYEEQSQPKEVSPTPDSHNFDNPVYESTTIIPGKVQLTSYQEKPKPDFEGSDPAPNPSEYEVVGEDLKALPQEEDFVKVDLGALGEADESGPVGDVYEPSSDMNTELVEEDPKGKKSGKYERF